MPRTQVVFFQEENGRVPALEAILEWARRDLRIASKCYDRIDLLKTLGHELRRPDGDYLRDEIYELRATWAKVHYRLLYFFSGQRAILACGVAKEGEVPDKDINLAIRYKGIYDSNPAVHTYVEDDEVPGETAVYAAQMPAKDETVAKSTAERKDRGKKNKRRR